MNRRHAGQVGIEALVVALGWAILAALLLRNRDFLHDDAFISLRYARHLAEYGVLEWNLGERVEGYTNFLHVLLTAGLIRLDIPPIWAAQGLNIAALAGLIVLQARALRMALPGPEHAMLRSLTVLVTAAVPGLAVWALGGLEAPFLAVLLLGGVSSVLAAERCDGRWGPALAAALWLSAAVLTRMDSAVFIAGLAFGVALFGSGPPLVRFGRATLVAALPAAVALAHMGWRLSYYGEALPLTFHAKIGTALGLRLAYLPEFLARSLPWLAGPVLSAALAVLVAATGRSPRLVGLIALPVALQLAYIGYSGGDHMIAGRVLVPLAAPLLLLGAVAFSGLGKSLAIAGAGAVAAVSAAAIVLVPPLRMDPAAFVGQIVGRHIAATWPSDSLVALHTAGSTPFHADTMTFIDGLGLNDPVIARRESFPLVAPMQRLPGHSKGGWRLCAIARTRFRDPGPSRRHDPRPALVPGRCRACRHARVRPVLCDHSRGNSLFRCIRPSRPITPAPADRYLLPANLPLMMRFSGTGSSGRGRPRSARTGSDTPCPATIPAFRPR